MKKEAVENGALLIHFSQPLLAGKNIPPKEQTICLGKDEVFHGNIYFYRYFPGMIEEPSSAPAARLSILRIFELKALSV